MLFTKAYLVYIDNMIVETNSEIETREFAQSFAKTLVGGDIILLHGDLGMGKSVFARAVIRRLCGAENLEVPSPTFTLVQTYDAPIGQVWHFDLYRLSSPDEIYDIGWEEALSGGIILVEWPERLGGLLPASYIDVRFSPVEGSPDKRKIEVLKHV